MQSLNNKELENVQTSKIEKRGAKPFEKVSPLDREEKPKKKSPGEELIDGYNLYSPEIKMPSSSPSFLEKTSISLQSLQIISSKIVKEIIVAKSKEETKTNFILQTKAFDQVEIEITVYSTDPFSYHIRLLGGEKIMELSLSHQNILQNQIKQAIPRIQVHVAPPILRKKDRFATKTKKSFEKSKGTCYGAIKRT
jgi:hypothetical protein